MIEGLYIPKDLLRELIALQNEPGARGGSVHSVDIT